MHFSPDQNEEVFRLKRNVRVGFRLVIARLQAAVFEAVYPAVEEIPLPAEVLLWACRSGTLPAADRQTARRLAKRPPNPTSSIERLASERGRESIDSNLRERFEIGFVIRGKLLDPMHQHSGDYIGIVETLAVERMAVEELP